MSDLIPPPDDRPDDTLAGEYALGVLDEAERRAVRLRARQDAALAAAITAWEERLAGLAQIISPESPPPALWDRLMQAVAPIEPDASADMVEPVPIARARATRTGSPGRTRWIWPTATGVSLALAAGLAGVLLLRPPPPPDFAAVHPEGLIRLASIGPLNTPAAAFVAEGKPDGTVVLRRVSPQPVPPGRTLQLWQVSPGAQAPVSLGVLPEGGLSVHLPALPPSGTQLLISQEPAGGSPTGLPTGPVLYGGVVQR